MVFKLIVNGLTKIESYANKITMKQKKLIPVIVLPNY